MRWAEVGGCSLIFRIDDGERNNGRWSYDADPATYAHLRRMIGLHARLVPYLKRLVSEAAATGHPVMRPLAFADPANPDAWRVEGEYLLGNDVLVAPVLRNGARHVDVWFPTGKWIELRAGRTHTGPHRWEVDAPLGDPAVFVRQGRDVLK